MSTEPLDDMVAALDQFKAELPDVSQEAIDRVAGLGADLDETYGE